jgi:hypothetical protein
MLFTIGEAAHYRRATQTPLFNFYLSYKCVCFYDFVQKWRIHCEICWMEEEDIELSHGGHGYI